MRWRGELVFAYGSNLSIAQMVRRCASSQFVARAELRGYELAFAGYSTRWAGPVATYTEARRRRVRGIVYSLSPADLARLDRIEGVPRVYERLRVPVHVDDERVLLVHAYRLSGFDRPSVPSSEYLGVIADAYRDWGFDRRHLMRAARAGARIHVV